MTDVVKKLGTVEELPSGRFRVRFSIGKRLKTVHTADSEVEAEQARATMARLLLEGGRQPDSAPMLAAFGFDVIDRRELSQKIEDTDTERSRWRTYVEADPIGKLVVRAVDDEEIEQWLDRLAAAGLARSTRQNALNLMRAVFRVACKKRRHHDGPNPCDGLRLESEKRTLEPWTYLTPDEQRALVGATPAPLDAIVEFAIGTGLRAGELVTLRLADVHVDDAEPHVIVRYGKPPSRPTKTGKIRRVPLFGHGLAAMRRWLAVLPPYCPKNPLGLAFPGPTGAFRSRAHVLRWALWRGSAEKPGIVKRAGIERDVRWHDLRHTCASSLVSGWWGDPEPRAWTLAEVCALLGHASITTTERYAHLADTALKRAAREAFPALSTPADASAKIASNLAGATLENRTRDLRFTNPTRTPEAGPASTARGKGRGKAEEFLEAVAGSAHHATLDRLARELAQGVLDAAAVALAVQITTSTRVDLAAAVRLAELELEADQGEAAIAATGGAR
jgi:integrase